MFNIGPQELLVILLVALVIVGPQRLPELSRTIGRGLREFRKAQDEVKKTIRLGLDETEPTTTGRTAAATPADPAAGDAPAPGEVAAPDEADPAADIARTLGRGLAEIRRTRREIQRTFRVDLSDPTSTKPSPRASAPSAAVEPTPSVPPSVPPSVVDPEGDRGPAEPGAPDPGTPE